MPKSSSGKKGYRSFTLVHASQVDGCPTKFSKGTRYIGRSPDSAARNREPGPQAAMQGWCPWPV